MADNFGVHALDMLLPEAGAIYVVDRGPIFTSFSRSVVSDQCSTSFGNASVRMKLPRL